eukprot:1002594-Rhodomonas_salina.1
MDGGGAGEGEGEAPVKALFPERVEVLRRLPLRHHLVAILGTQQSSQHRVDSKLLMRSTQSASTEQTVTRGKCGKQSRISAHTSCRGTVWTEQQAQSSLGHGAVTLGNSASTGSARQQCQRRSRKGQRCCRKLSISNSHHHWHYRHHRRLGHGHGCRRRHRRRHHRRRHHHHHHHHHH